MGTRDNYGIQVSGGNFEAVNVAVGENARVVSGDVLQEVRRTLGEVRDLVEEAALGPVEGQAATAAVQTLEAEAVSKAPRPDRVTSALERLKLLGTASAALLPLADRLAPLLDRVGTLLLR